MIILPPLPSSPAPYLLPFPKRWYHIETVMLSVKSDLENIDPFRPHQEYYAFSQK